MGEILVEPLNMLSGSKRLKWKKDLLVYEGMLLGIIILGVVCLGIFGYVVINFKISQMGFVEKLLIFGLGVFGLFGEFFVVDRLRDCWYEAKGNELVIQFFRQPQNKYSYLRITIPEDCNYSLGDLRGFFKTAHYSALFSDYTTERRLNYGIGSYDICFEFVIENGEIEVYLAVSLCLKEFVVKALFDHIKDIKIVQCENPFANYPKEWHDGVGIDGYDTMTGTSLGFQLTNSLTTIPTDNLDLNALPLDNLIKILRTNFVNQRIILQYVFTFENRHVTKVFEKELKVLRQSIYNKFSLRFADIGADNEILTILLPKLEQVRLDQMEDRLRPNNRFISANIKVIAFCKKEDYIAAEDRLEKAIRGYGGNTAYYRDSNKVEKVFFTASSQRYYNLEGKNEHPGLDYLYDTFWFPPAWLEPLLSWLYDIFYYYNENRYRRKVIYRRTLRRSGQGPWINKNTTLDFDSLVAVFQIPKV